MLDSTFSDLSLVAGLALAAGLLATRLRLPPVVGLLLVGAAMGPHGFGLVQATDLSSSLAEVGSVLLLFLIGVEFSLFKLLELGLKPALVAALKMGVVFFAVHQVALALGFPADAALYLGAMFSVSSTALLSRVLEQNKLERHSAVPLLMGELVVEDVLAVLAMTFLAGALGGPAPTALDVVSSLMLAFTVLGVAYLFGRHLLARVLDAFGDEPPVDTLVFAGLGSCLTLSIVSAAVGLPSAIGAFLAGSIVASLPQAHRLESAMRPFGLTLASLFFLSIGMLVDPVTALANAGPSLAFLLTFAVVAFLSTAVLVRAVGGSFREAAFTGLSLGFVGEFTLLLAQQGTRATGVDLVGIASSAVLITSVTGSLLLSRHDVVERALEWNTPRSLRRVFDLVSEALARALAGFEGGGIVLRELERQLGRATRDLRVIVLAAFLYLVARPLLLREYVDVLGVPVSALAFLSSGLGLLALPSALRVLGRLAEVADASLGSLRPLGLSHNQARDFWWQILTSAALIQSGLTLPYVIVTSGLPPSLSFLGYALLAGGILLLVNALRRLSPRLR